MEMQLLHYIFILKILLFFSADINPDMFFYRSKRIKNFFTDTSSRRFYSRKTFK